MSRKGDRTLPDLLVGCDRVVVLHEPGLTDDELSALPLPKDALVLDLAAACAETPVADAVVLVTHDLAGLRRCVSAVDRELVAAAVGVVVLGDPATPPVLVPHPSFPPLLALDVQRGDAALAVARFATEASVVRVLAAFGRSVALGTALDPAGWPAVGALRSEPHRWPVADPAATVGDVDRVHDLGVDFPPSLVVADAVPTADDPDTAHPVTGRPPVTVGVGPEPTWRDDLDLARLRAGGPLSLGPLDDRLLSPVGFKRQHRRPVARLVAHEDTTRLGLRTAQGTTTVDARHGPSEQDLDGLRRLAAVQLGWEGGRGPHAYARVVAGLAMAGVPLLSHQVPDWAAALLHPDLVTALDAAPADLDDIVEREAHSIRLRRAALGHHGQAGWRRDAGHAHGLQTTPEPRVSVLLPTRRPEQVEFALRQVARQRGADVELVLVTHGFAAEPAALDAFRASGRTLTAIEAPGDVVFGALLNLAARAASGDVLLKMDDDDWYGRDFVADLLLARRYSGADIVGTPPEFTFVEPLWLTVRRQDATEAYRPVVAGGTMLVDRGALASVGGFRETRKYVDAGLLAAVVDAGGSVYRSHGHGYVLRRGAQGHTWDPGLGYFVSRKLSWHQWRGFRPSPLLDADDVDVPHRTNTDGRSGA